MAILEAVFADKAGQTPQEVERRRRMAQALMEAGSGGPAPSSSLELAGRLAMNLMGQYQAGKAEKQDASNRTAANKALIDAVYGGSSGSAPSFNSQAAATSPSASVSGPPSTTTGGKIDPSIRSGIVQTAKSLGVDPVDLATAISYETGGTFDPTKSGPTTKYGTHRGFIQFGEPQARQHGVNWDDPINSQLGENGAVASYLRAAGVKPGMGLLDIYSAINAGGVGRYGASDAAAGGAPGTVADKVNSQMAGHRAKALAFIGEPQQVASLDPSVGMPPRTATEAVTAMGAGGSAPGSLSDEVAAYQQTPEYAARFPGRAVAPSFPGKQADDMAVAALPQPRNVGALPVPPDAQPMPQGIPAEFSGSQQLANAQGGIVPALMGGTAASPEQIAQARALGAAQPQPQPQGQDNRALIATLLGNPYTAEAGQQLLMQEMQRRQEANDPMQAMKMEEQRLRLDAMRNPKPEYDIIQDKSTGEVIAVDRNNPTAGPQVVRQGGLPMEEAPTTRTIKQPDGSEVAVQWDKENRQWVPLQAPEGGNAVQAIPKLTEQQSKDLVYYQRGEAALKNLNDLEQALTSTADSLLSGVPVIGNKMVSNEFQQADQAGRNFLASILRKDTGAAVTANEMEEYGKIFLPRPGDSPETLAQKRQARTDALQAIRSGLGVAERVLQNKQKAAPVTIDGYTIEEVD